MQDIILPMQRFATRKSHTIAIYGPPRAACESIFGETEFVTFPTTYDTDYHLRRSCTILVVSYASILFRLSQSSIKIINAQRYVKFPKNKCEV